MRQQLIDSVVRIREQALEHIFEVNHGSCPCSLAGLADCARLMIVAARCPASSLPAKSHAFLPMARGFMRFSI